MKHNSSNLLTKLLLVFLLMISSFNYVKAEEPSNDSKTDNSEEHVNGYIESDLDRGLDAYYPEVESYANEDLPTKYPTSEDPIGEIGDKYPANRNQGIFGTCWSFSSIGLLEFDLIKNHGISKDIDLSELQLVYNSFNFVEDPLS